MRGNILVSTLVVITASIGLTIVVGDSAYAATFTVNSMNDAPDSNPGDGKCEAVGIGCTLRAAIEESNAIVGYPPAQINLPAGTYRLTLGELTIQDSLFLTGDTPVSSTIIDGNRNSRVFSIDNKGSNPIVNMSNLTIRNGNGGSFISGGGIYISQGSYLSLTNSIVSDNEARQFGGGISNAGSLQLIRSTVRNNQVPTDGGGGQTASGGGIFNFQGGTVEINSSTINDNKATRGGAIRNAGGSLRITNSTISGNRASTRGGGIMTSGTADISYSTIAFNEANAPLGQGGFGEPRIGGGIFNDRGSVNIGNTILAHNIDNRNRFDSSYAPDCFSEPPEDSVISGRFITSFRGNLVGISNNSCKIRDTIYGEDSSFDLVGTADNPINPQLGSLNNNGGSTQTHSLLSNSPAIDKGNGITSARFFDCPSTDQRGATRPSDGNSDGNAVCDIGAFEFGASIPAQ